MMKFIKTVFKSTDVEKKAYVGGKKSFNILEPVEERPSLDSLIATRMLYVNYKEGEIKTADGVTLLSMEQSRELFLDVKFVQVTLKQYNRDFQQTLEQYNAITADNEKYLSVVNKYGKKFIDSLQNHLTEINKERDEFIQAMNETIIYRFWKQLEKHNKCPGAEINLEKWASCQVG
ncbi:hypothetical protein PUS82_05300 [Cytobacillus firmus]|uniref:hypothetical protein n=1 Tax=Cytobacillus firmus TaxID=1399 RepID=UPI00237AFC34|nr:hypothetical protein [Cytobacillus firmus]MDD9310719.1 hypothetical protein [Cytobacillus firmus]